MSNLPRSQLALSIADSSLEIPSKSSNLVKRNVASTSYPEPCLVCHQNQCEYDLRHEMYFNIKRALEEQLENVYKKKPPDDACGLLVATYKELDEASF